MKKPGEIYAGRARPPGGPQNHAYAKPERTNLNHTPPPWVKSGALFFVTVCCEQRTANHLCTPIIGPSLLDAAQFYHAQQRWFVRLLLLMPDHVHGLVAPAPNVTLARILGDWKRYATTHHAVVWQKNFIDHRLRSDESWEEKASYIRLNPIRAGLIRAEEPWPYIVEN